MSNEIKQCSRMGISLDGMPKSIRQAVATELGTNSEGEMKDIFKIEQCSKSKVFGSVWGVNNRLQSDKTMLHYFVEY